MNPALRQGFRRWRKRLYAGLPARALTKHVSLSQAGRRSIVDRQATDQITKRNLVAQIIRFVIDRLDKYSGTGVSPAAFWSLFRRGKSDPGPGRGGPGAIEQHGAHSVEKIPLAGGAGSKPNEKRKIPYG